VKEQGKVIKTENGKVTIEISPKEACTKCCSCTASKMRHIVISEEKDKNLSIGDIIEYEIPSSQMLKIYLLLYGIPLVVFVGAILAVYAFYAHPLISFFAGLAATILSYIIIGLFIRKASWYLGSVCAKKPQ